MSSPACGSISDVDWRDLVEASSLVDGILAEGSNFREMDFATRNLYRSAIEQLARGSGVDEIDVARASCVPFRMRRLRQPERKTTLPDPGYVLLAAGRAGFEQELGYRRPFAPAWHG
jgi:cyclic beta-1,2-glucan synthetase